MKAVKSGEVIVNMKYCIGLLSLWLQSGFGFS